MKNILKLAVGPLGVALVLLGPLFEVAVLIYFFYSWTIASGPTNETVLIGICALIIRDTSRRFSNDRR